MEQNTNFSNKSEEEKVQMIEKLYPLDDEHTAIPNPPPEQLKECILAAMRIKEGVLGGVIKIAEEWQSDKYNIPTSSPQPEQIYLLRVVQDVYDRVKIPQYASLLFSGLGLSFDNPAQIYYALSYIQTLGAIQRAKSMIPAKELSEEVRNWKNIFAQTELMLQESQAVMRVSRDEMMQIRGLVEEAFLKNPNPFPPV